LKIQKKYPTKYTGTIMADFEDPETRPLIPRTTDAIVLDAEANLKLSKV
jgi:hypothetical protein